MASSIQTRLQLRFGNRNVQGMSLSSLLDSSNALKSNATLTQWMQVIDSFYSPLSDPSGKLNFAGKAVLDAQGVDFSNGSSYKINLQDLRLLGELGKGQYGQVQKVVHQPTGVVMAMKEIRLELDQQTLHQILMELNVLHQSTCPFIVEFYGAFFVESCVYFCIEYMNAGSMDKLYGDGVPEHILAKVTVAVVKGLKALKDELSVIHRDVKPTNILVNLRGDIKLCDFGVSGQLVQSLAKTHIGCQSYMAPERITNQYPLRESHSTYSASSDVWSLGLSLLEMGLGHYPFPLTQYDSVFAQLDAIVRREPPELDDRFSDLARQFVKSCLVKSPQDRPTYAQLLQHPWLEPYAKQDNQDVARWAQEALFIASAAKLSY